MKHELTTSQAAHELLQDEYANWSYKGAHALIEHLEQMEEDCDTQIEFDRVAIRCDFNEYADLQEFAGEYDEIDFGDCEGMYEQDEIIREYIRDHGDLIEFDGGIIVSSF